MHKNDGKKTISKQSILKSGWKNYQKKSFYCNSRRIHSRGQTWWKGT
jgi:hypothetical protein